MYYYYYYYYQYDYTSNARVELHGVEVVEELAHFGGVHSAREHYQKDPGFWGLLCPLE